MTLDEAMAEIANLVKCVPWEPNNTPHMCPTGELYEQHILFAYHNYFGGEEPARSALCNMLASQIKNNRNRLLRWADLIFEKDKIQKTPVLYWRVEPEMENRKDKNDNFTAVYLRYVMVLVPDNVSRETQGP
jgi:hypothetical protein